MNTRNRRAFSSASDFFEKYEAVGLYQSISNVLEHIGAFSPGRVEDILEACGAFDLGSSPSRDVLLGNFTKSRMFFQTFFSDLSWSGL